MRDPQSASNDKRRRSKSRTVAPPRIVYLLGAGATHAELINACADRVTEGKFLEDNSLLLADVSKRVCKVAITENVFGDSIARQLSMSGLSNIELFISLIEKNLIPNRETIVNTLKKLVKSDINARIRRYKKYFLLHKALFEYHKLQTAETLTGVISLNYDGLADDAYKIVNGAQPNHCLSSQDSVIDALPLLKLHGGFQLKFRKKKLPIITPGINKNYLELPYSFVWGRALELLLDCDVLRIIGCSLSQNDVGIIDMIFKAHVIRQKPIVLQIIDFDPVNNKIKEQFGFLPIIETAIKIETNLITDVAIQDSSSGSNPFKIWLKAKIERTLSKSVIMNSTYVARILE